MFDIDIECISEITQTASGVIIKYAYDDLAERQHTVGIPTHAFDILHEFISVRLTLLRGDFGKYKEYESTRIAKMNALILGNHVFRIQQDHTNEHENEILSKLYNFSTLCGLYQPKHHAAGICEWLNIAQAIPFNRGVNIEDMTRLMNSAQDRHRNDYTDELESIGIKGSFNEPLYTLVIPRRGNIAVGGHWVAPPNHREMMSRTPYIPFEFNSAELYQLSDVINGISNMVTLPMGGYELKLSNGLGEVKLGVLSKHDLWNLVDIISR